VTLRWFHGLFRRDHKTTCHRRRAMRRRAPPFDCAKCHHSRVLTNWRNSLLSCCCSNKRARSFQTEPGVGFHHRVQPPKEFRWGAWWSGASCIRGQGGAANRPVTRLLCTLSSGIVNSNRHLLKLGSPTNAVAGWACTYCRFHQNYCRPGPTTARHVGNMPRLMRAFSTGLVGDHQPSLDPHRACFGRDLLAGRNCICFRSV